MMTARAHQVRTLRLRSDSRDSLSATVSLIEAALHLACDGLDDAAVLPPGKGALIFVRKISLGKISLSSHAQLLADSIRTQMQHGMLRLACIDDSEADDADIVWFSDAITAWSRLLMPGEKKHWYWPLLRQELDSPEVQLQPDKVLPTIEYQLGKGAIEKLVRLLLAKQQLVPFVAALNIVPTSDDAVVVSPNTVNERTIPIELSDKVLQFIAQFSAAEINHLMLVTRQLQTNPQKMQWLLQVFTRGQLWLQRLPPLMRSAVYTKIECLLLDNSRRVAAASAAIKSVPQKSIDECRSPMREASVAHNEQRRPKTSTVPESLGTEHKPIADEPTINDEKGELNTPPTKYEKTSYDAQVGLAIDTAGVFFLLNLLESLVPRNCLFVNFAEAPNKALFAWLLHKLDCGAAVEALGFEAYSIENLLEEPLTTLQLSARWGRWSGVNQLQSERQTGCYGDWLNLVVKTLSRFLWRQTGAGIKSLSRMKGELVVTHTHIDVYLDSDNLSLTFRRLGLDISPGWLPWLERVVTFHYRGDNTRTYSLQ